MADPDKSDPVAIAALVISVVALFAAISQIAQAIFASARGLPNCDERVIGKWALKKWAFRHSRTRLRLQEFRLEVFFKAPIIFLAPASNPKKPTDGELRVADGTDQSCAEFHIDPEDVAWKSGKEEPGQNEKEKKEPVHTVENEKATWIWLLVAIQRMERDSRKWEKDFVKAAGPGRVPIYEKPTLTIQMQPKQRSFDTNPAIKKPYATTTISHLVELAAVLGLYWKVFDQDENKYRAAGNEYSLMGSRVPDFGIVFVFEKTGAPEFQSRRIIPTSEVKELCFGRLPTLYRRKPEGSAEDVSWQDLSKTSSGDKNLKVEVLQLGSRDEIAETLTQIGCNATTALYYKNEKKHQHLFPVTFEIIGMLARTLHIRNRCFRFLPNPTIFPWDRDSLSLTRLLAAFCACIQKHNETIQDELLQKTFESEVQSEVDRIDQLVKDSQSLLGEIMTDDQLNYFKLNLVHDSIDKADKLLTEGDSPSSNQKVVLDVLRRHLQEVLAAVNKDTSDRGDSPSFGDILDVPPEMREQRFMDIYFNRVLWLVIPMFTNSSEKDDQEEVSRTIHHVDDKRKSHILSGQESPEVDDQALSFSRSTIKDPKANLRDERYTLGLKAALTRHEETQRLQIWYTLVFRMICWLILHEFDKKDIQVPSSDLMGNRQPVFIM
ncbi:modin [Colletotrichum truncatum]|uniref:Modin n=1 Tax=Colletotrichum truncatum TaxID=5467 RepID=A0ACC3Z2A2_COLTU|nr:modin [Colletotrichum truncatum]KAF6786513.1 modin [Colletotrichum truncatum]